MAIINIISVMLIRYAVRGEEVARGSKITDNIIIGTPGKVIFISYIDPKIKLQVLDWSLKFRFFDLSKITVFVLDEADVMIATQVGLLLIEKALSPQLSGTSRPEHQDSQEPGTLLPDAAILCYL